MTENIWEKEMKDLYKELVRDYMDEGYERQDAQHMAKAEVQEMYGDEAEFAFGIADKRLED